MCKEDPDFILIEAVADIWSRAGAGFAGALFDSLGASSESNNSFKLKPRREPLNSGIGRPTLERHDAHSKECGAARAYRGVIPRKDAPISLPG